MLWTHVVLYIIAYFGLFTASFFLLTYFGGRKKERDPEPKRFPFVSIIINMWNEEKAIARTMRSILNLDYPKNKYEIIVVDDGSTDRTYEIAKSYSGSLPHVRVFKKENGGAASAKNYGLKKARGEIIATLDADSFVSKDALKKMVGYFEDKDVWSVTAALNVYKPKRFLQHLQWAEYIMSIFLRKVFSIADAIHVIPGPFSLFRKEFFKKHGDFDEGNITEDTEIAMRIQSLEYKIKNSVSANIYTLLPSTLGGLMKQRIRWYYGFIHNSLQYKQLFNPIRRRDNLAVLILPAALISVVLSILAVFIFFYENIILLEDNVIRLMVTDFDILPSLLSIDWGYIKEFIISYVSNPLIAFIIIGMACAAMLIILGKKESKEKRKMVWAFVSFFLTYWFFYASWWIGTFIYRGVLRRKIKWGPRYY
ncbi:MAG: glycosyltransferase family 2 protein [Candidatus Pacearchaeota archaeon]|nr:MAG: glycosyltransferase family 2 protein [Candidatus Pacearchaeota archaeon]